MTVIMKTRLPITRQELEALSKSMGVREDPPAGLIVHTAYEDGQGVQVLDVWESREAFESFAGSRLADAMGSFGSEQGGSPAPPQTEFTEVFDVVRGQ